MLFGSVPQRAASIWDLMLSSNGLDFSKRKE
jgi:hypothetical protein